MTKKVFPGTCKGVRLGERLTNGCGKRYNAFTLIELIVVVGIITVLAGLVLSTAGYARKKGQRARAETEIAAMSAACESYKADNGVYPRGNANLSNTAPYDTDNLNAQADGDPTADPTATRYKKASLYLYIQLSGTNANRTPITGARSYFTFKPNQLSPTDQNLPVEFIRDPFGNSYGYSTANQLGDPTKGYNPTFDLWSTSALTATPGGTPDTITPQWVKNW
jgi:prepilin-type N-terminal cleavage/methylation domain-containing protein